MKQLLILMVFLLAVMLVFSGVMAVGNAKQSVQIADRVQQLSNLKAELRSVQKENRQLTKELETAQASSRKLRWQQQAVAKQLAGVLSLAESKAPVLPHTGGSRADGEVLLQAMAVKQTLTAAKAAWGGLRAKAAALAGKGADGSRICWAAVHGDKTDGETAAVAAVGSAEGITNSPVLSAGVAAGVGIALAGGAAEDGGLLAGRAAEDGGLLAGGAAEDGGLLAGGAVGGTCCGRVCCCEAERLTGRGTVLAVSEAVTVPVCAGEPDAAEAAARLMPLLQKHMAQMGEMLRSLLELAHTLVESLADVPVGVGV